VDPQTHKKKEDGPIKLSVKAPNEALNFGQGGKRDRVSSGEKYDEIEKQILEVLAYQAESWGGSKN